MAVSVAAEKSKDAFRTISEVAAELDVPQHVLRFWETKFPVVKPLKRGGGRRYYRPDDLDLLRGIRSLLYSDGLTIKGVQKILREQGPRYVMELGRGATTLIMSRREREARPVDDEAEAEAEAEMSSADSDASAESGSEFDESTEIGATDDEKEPTAGFPHPFTGEVSSGAFAEEDGGGISTTESGETAFTEADRAHFAALLEELIQLKSRLKSARRIAEVPR